MTNNIIKEIESNNYIFNVKYDKLYKQYQDFFENYLFFLEIIKKMSINNDNYNKYCEIINDILNETTYLLDYLIKIIMKEIILDDNFVNIITYNNNNESYKYYSDKLFIIKRKKIENIVNQLFVNSITEYKKVKNDFEEIINNELENNSDYIIFLGKPTNIKKINDKKYIDFKKKWDIIINECKNIYNLFNKIIKIKNNINDEYDEYMLESYYFICEICKLSAVNLLNKLTEPINNYNKDNMCSICICKINKKCFIKCGHSFCYNCIDIYIKNGGNYCPNCKFIL